MNEILFSCLMVTLAFSGMLCGVLFTDKADRSRVFDATNKTFQDVEKIMVNLQKIHNENVSKILEIQDKIAALEFRMKGK